MMTVLTGARAILSAAHYGPDGMMHGHTWTIRAFWTGEPCAVEMQGKLANWIGRFDHGILPIGMSRGEDIARQIIMALGCVRVEVSRDAEGIFAIVEMTSPAIPQSERTDA